MVKCHLVVILASLAIAGCTGFTELTYRHSQKERAQDAWKVAGAPGSGGDYKDGWQTGYYDVCMGSDGQVPAVPPKKYWHDKYQCPEGQQFISDWYSGYQDGVIAAEHVGEFEWQLVPSSGVAALPSATVDDYPTFYSSPPAAENDLPEPMPTEPPATAEHRQLPPASQQESNDAAVAAAQPPLDLRTLTGRPSAPTVASPPMQRLAEVTPPAPRRDYERVPLPAHDLPLATIARENEPQAPAANVRDFAPLPGIVSKQRLVMEWPASTAAPRPTTSPVPNWATKPASPVASPQQPTNRPANVEVNESKSVLTDRSTSDQPLVVKSIVDETPSVDAKPTESKLHREQVVSREPSPSVPSRGATPMGAPVVASAPPIAIFPVNENADSMPRSLAPIAGATITEPTTELTQTFRESEHAGGSLSDAHWATESARMNSALERAGTIVADANEATDASTEDVVNVPPRADERAITRPHRPVVMAAQPIRIPTQVAADRAPVQTVEAAKPVASELTDNAETKELLAQSKSSQARQGGRPGEFPNLQASSQTGSSEPVVRLAEQFSLNSSDGQPKSIVVAARPLHLPDASTSRR